MKCGTTSAFHYLSAHPEIAPATKKEPDFFTKHWDRGWEWYEELWPIDVGDRWALEASTSYTKVPTLPNAAARIATTSAEYRFIYVMRDPLARIESHRRHQFLRGRGTLVNEHLVAVSRYAAQLDEYRKRFARESILLLGFEQLSANPSATLRQISEFLDIDPAFSFPAQHTTFNKSAPDGKGYELLRSIPVLSHLAKKLPLRWRRSVRNRLAKAPPKLPPLNAAERADIRAALTDDMTRLRDEYGFDTAIWRSLE